MAFGPRQSFLGGKYTVVGDTVTVRTFILGTGMKVSATKDWEISSKEEEMRLFY